MNYSINVLKDGKSINVEGELLREVVNEVAKLGGSKQQLIKDLSDAIELKYKHFEKHFRDSILTKNMTNWNEMEREEISKIEAIPEPELIPLPPKPDRMKSRYQITKSMTHIFFHKKKKEAIKEREDLLQADLNFWENNCIQIKNENTRLKNHYSVLQNNRLKKIEIIRSSIEATKNNYYLGNPASVAQIIKYILIKSRFDEMESVKEMVLEFLKDTGLLIVDYFLPSFDETYQVKELRYIRSNDEVKEVEFSKVQRKKLFNDFCLKVTLRVIDSIFKIDKEKNPVSSVVFNGFINTIDRSSGIKICPCILTISVKKEEIISFNLLEVDPKECFKRLRGISAPELSNLTPVAPIIKMSKIDKRFIEGYEVVKDIDDTTNLAAMDWEDFENLIREIFEKEFSQGDAEVKITRASRDGGVDAVAFDPDPIRGGKIVIQAKRYTNVVGVSAVRDLYGTVMNEGAIKGILVTTSNYGSDAYDFAKDKPLTLLNGSNLLHLLEKHGHRAKIDLIEAKRILKEEQQ